MNDGSGWVYLGERRRMEKGNSKNFGTVNFLYFYLDFLVGICGERWLGFEIRIILEKKI